MKKLLLCFSAIAVIACNKTATSSPSTPASPVQSNPKVQLFDAEIDGKVSALVSKMSLEEKVGQMTQLTLDAITTGDSPYSSASPYALDPKKVAHAIEKYKIGSVLNTPGHPLSRKEWFETITTLQEAAAKTPNKIPLIYGIDAIHGVNYTTESTLFPQQLGVASTFNKQHAYESGVVSAYETRASAIPWTFSPVLGLGRSPIWPRLWETFGEDVHIGETMGAAMIKGFQGDGGLNSVAACMKHYLGYSVPLSGKDRTGAWIPERELRQYFVPAFKAAIDAGALTLMINSGDINGTPVHASKFMLTDLLRGELGFEGFAVTDWNDINYLYTKYKIVKTKKEAIKVSINAGVDMSMVPHQLEFVDLLIELVNEGEVKMSRIDEAVSRILKVKYKLGLFDKPVTDPKDYPDFGSEKFAAKSKAAALETFVLLKNKKNLLPLKKETKILVTGASANTMRSLNGGWSYNWQGSEADKYAADKNTVAEAFMKNGNAKFVQGVTFDGTGDNIAKSVAAARNSDVVLLCLGETSYTETPGNTHSLLMPNKHVELAKELAKTGKKIILVLLEGRPVIFNEIEPLVDAVFVGFLPGNYGADALSDLVYGVANPSGKLPVNYPKHPHSFVNYNYKISDNLQLPNYYSSDYDQQYEFGDGLSYTTFAYSDLKLDTKEMTQDGKINVSVTVTNTGKIAGKEAVLLYISDLYATITPEIKALKAYDKITLAPGASKTVKFVINKKSLSFVNANLKTVAEPGEFTATVGLLSENFILK